MVSVGFVMVSVGFVAVESVGLVAVVSVGLIVVYGLLACTLITRVSPAVAPCTSVAWNTTRAKPLS